MTPRDLALHDAELIAAFVDKRLSEEERSAFLARLDKDEALYEVFVETVRYRDQETAEGGKVLEPSVWSRKWRLVAAVAALIALAVATPVLIRSFSERSYAEALVADGRLKPYLGEGWYEQEWPVLRGSSISLDPEALAFRTGVHVVDLEVALRSGRRDDVGILTLRIEALLGSIRNGEALVALYAEIRDLAEDGISRRLLLEKARSAEIALKSDSPVFAHAFELGQWTEAGKLAVLSGSRDFLTAQSFRRNLDGFRQLEWREGVGELLEELAELLAVRREGLDLRRLGDKFRSTIRLV